MTNREIKMHYINYARTEMMIEYERNYENQLNDPSLFAVRDVIARAEQYYNGATKQC